MNEPNGTLDALLPPWVRMKLRKFILERRSGEFNMVCSDGGVRGVKVTDYEQAPDKKKNKQ